MAGGEIFELSKLISNPGYDWIVETIFSKLDPESLAKCRLVSKACKERIDNRRSLLVLQLQAMKQRRLNNPFGQEWYQSIGADLVKVKCSFIEFFPEFEQAFLDLERQATLHELQVVVATMRDYLKDGRIRMEKSESNPSERAPSSPFHQAIVNGNQEFLNILLRRTTLDAQCIKENFQFLDGMTPLHLAARHGHYEVVKVLLEFSSDLEIDVNALDFNGMTPFIRALAHGHLQVVKLMIDQSRMYHIDLRIKEDIQFSNGMTPLHLAARHGHDKVVKLLLEFSSDLEIDVNALDLNGMAPLHLAARHGHYDVVKVLLEFSCDSEIDVNALDFNGMTPFIRALVHGHLQVAKLMFEQSRMYHIDLNVPLKYFPRIFIMFPFFNELWKVTMSFVVFMLGYKLGGFMNNFI